MGSLIDIVSVAGASPNWNLTVVSSAGAQVGDHLTAPLVDPPAGRGGLYRITAIPDGTHIDVADDLDPDGGVYGEPGAGSGQFFTPTSSYGLSQNVDSGPYWGVPARRDNVLLDREIAESQEIRTKEDLVITVDYATGTTPPSDLILSTQAEVDAFGPLKHCQEALESLPPFVDHNVVVQVAAGRQYAVQRAALGLGGVIDTTVLPSNSNKSDYDNFLASELYERYIGVNFVGSTDTLESGISGTLSIVDGRTVFTRDSGAWVAGEYARKFSSIQSGASAGNEYPIIDNTETELLLSTEVYTTGAAVLDIYDLTTELISELADGTNVFYTLNLGNQSKKFNLTFQHLNFGSSTIRGYCTGAFALSTFFYYCRFYDWGRYDGPGGYIVFGNCIFDFDPAAPGGLYLYSKLHANIFNSILRGHGDGNTMLYCRDDVHLYTTCLHLLVDPSYTQGAWTMIASSCEVQRRSIIHGGGASCYGLYLIGSAFNRMEDSNRITVNDCSIGVYLNNADTILGAIEGAGNDTGYRLVNGSRLRLDAGATLDATTFAQIDGENIDASDLSNAGDRVTGPQGSTILVY